MKKLSSLALLLAAASPALLPTARAQLTTFDTIQDYGGANGFTGNSSTQNFVSGTALTQTFSDVEEITDMTYQFVSNVESSSASDSLTAYLVEWSENGSGTTGKATTATAIWSEQFTVTPTGSAGWQTYQYAGSGNNYLGYDVTLDVDQILDPDDTYAIILVDTSASGDLELLSLQNADFSPGEADSGDAFNYGDDYIKNITSGNYSTNNTQSALNYLASNNSSFGGGDWGFSQLDVVLGDNPADLVPLPEPRTAAVYLAGLFVAVLVGRQLYLRRRMPVQAPTFA